MNEQIVGFLASLANLLWSDWQRIIALQDQRWADAFNRAFSTAQTTEIDGYIMDAVVIFAPSWAQDLSFSPNDQIKLAYGASLALGIGEDNLGKEDFEILLAPFTGIWPPKEMEVTYE